MHQNKRWSLTLRHLVKLILGCHIVRLLLPTLHLEQTLGEWRKTIQENEYNGTFNQSGHQTQLTFILPLKMEISKEGSTILAFFILFLYFILLSTVSLLCTSQRNLFENTIAAVQALKSRPDMIWHLWVSQFLQCQNRQTGQCPNIAKS